VAASTPGTPWAWGGNGSGELGNGTNTDSYTPVQVSNLTGVTSISAGMRFTLAVKSDGTAWAWGANYLGDGTINSSNIPVQVKSPAFTTVGGYSSSGYLTDVVAVATGWDHGMALTSDGIVLAWGSNYYGQLGDNTNTDSYIPVAVLNPNNIYLALGDVVAIAAGGYFSLALKSDGTVWAWGRGFLGQLGNGDTSDSNIPVQVKDSTGTDYLTHVVAISAGSTHSLACKAPTLTITVDASADSGGSITPSGAVPVSWGADQPFTIKPDSGYNIANVVVDGVSQGAITDYTFAKVTAIHMIRADFYASTSTIVATKVKSVNGYQVVDASAEAQTTVTVTTSASVNITVEQYSGNPHPEASAPANMLPRYNDITVSDLNAIVWPMHVEQTYTDADIVGLNESSLRMYYFKDGDWHQCSDTGVNTGANFV